MLDQDDDFVAICDFARHYYHSHKWQIMPLSPRSKIPPKDFAAIDLQKGLLDEESFDKMWGPNGSFVVNNNCGVLCGSPSSGLFVVDLDTQKPGSRAQAWWDDLHSMRPHPETPTQVTGSGGTQIFFKMPAGLKAFNHKNAYLNVDFQGEGAYVVLPPSIHPNGNRYRWVDGLSPDECDIMVLPDYLVEEITRIIGHVSDSSGSSNRVKTETPSHQVDSWGHVTDGREDKMTRMIFRTVLEMYRDCPIIPSEAEQRDYLKRCFENYLEQVESRIHEPGTEKHVLLNREGRGIDLFKQKWRAAMRQWDGKISDEAKRPWTPPEPVKGSSFTNSEETEETSEGDRKLKIEPPATSASIFTLMRTGAIMEMPDPEYLVDNLISSESFGFVIGVPGCLKSFITLDLSLSIAAGLKEWMGYKIKKNGPVVYVTSEGLGDIKRRIQAWEKKTKKKVKDIPFYLVPDSMNMMQQPDVMKLARTIKAVQEAEGAAPVMVVIDTASRVLPGADENLQKDMTLFVKACDYIRESFKCAVLAVHHLSRNGNGTMRGSTVFDGASDFIFLIEREPGQMVGSITAKKIKSAVDGWTIEFIVKEVELVSGIDPKTSLYIELATVKSGFDPGFGGAQETGFFFAGGMKIDIAMRDKILTDIKNAWDGHHPWSIAQNMRHDIRHAYRQVKKSLGKKITDMKAKDVIDSLIDNEWIEESMLDKKSKTKGLNIKNDPRKSAEVPAFSVGSRLETSETLSDDYNDL